MTLVLSQLVLDGHHPSVRRDLRDAHELHRTVMRAFPDIADGEPRNRHGVLYRVERGGLRPVVLVQSACEPRWDEVAGVLEARTRTFDPAALGLHAERRLRFCLEANPTRKIARFNPDGTRKRQGARVELTDDGARLAWLARAAARNGFELASVTGTDGDVPDVRLTLLPRRFGTRGGRRIVVQPVRFEGHLRVTDPNALIAALGSGIGPAKAYGCGLLSLAPPTAG